MRFRIASPRIPIDLGCASVNRNCWGGDPESLGANRSAYYPRDQSLFVYYCTMNFIQEQGLAKSRSRAHFYNLLLLSIGGLLTTSGCLLTEMTQTSQ